MLQQEQREEGRKEAFGNGGGGRSAPALPMRPLHSEEAPKALAAFLQEHSPHGRSALPYHSCTVALSTPALVSLNLRLVPG